MTDAGFDRRLYRNAPPAGLESAVLRAYEGAVYRVGEGSRAFELGIGRRGVVFQDELRRLGVESLVGITAYHPRAARRSGPENREAQGRLEARIKAGPWVALLKGVNLDPEGLWEPEPSLWVPGMDLEAGLALGAEFGQHAIVFLATDGIPRLAFCPLERL